MDAPKDLSAAEPDSIYQMIGQTTVRNQVTTLVDAAQQDGRMVDSPILMVGPGGCGKTQTARCIASMVCAADFRTVLASSLRTPADLAACLLELPAGAVLFSASRHTDVTRAERFDGVYIVDFRTDCCT